MIDERLAAALAAAPECITPAKLAAMIELSESKVLDLIAAGELPPLVPIRGVPAWTVEDLRVWLRRHEPLWDEGDADEPDWFPHGPAIEQVEIDFGAVARDLTSFRDPGPPRLTRDELIALDRKYGPTMRGMIARIDGGCRV